MYRRSRPQVALHAGFACVATLALACAELSLKGPYPETSMQDDPEGDWDDNCTDMGVPGPDGMDITRIEIEADSGSADTLVLIYFKDDNESYMVANNLNASGVYVSAQFELDSGTFVDSFTTSGGGFKVSGGTAGVSQDWTSEGLIMRLRYTGFGPSQVMTGIFEAARLDSQAGSYCDRVRISN